MTGRLHAIHTSPGGVPKLARESCIVTFGGLEGDWQRDREHHGGPDRAVSLFSLEVIRALQAEGHPIAPGTTGENLTLEGFAWTDLGPGLRVAIGDVELQIVSYAAPCNNINGSFSDGRSVRVSQKVHPGWSRLYARVLAEGKLRVGDAVRVLQG